MEYPFLYASRFCRTSCSMYYATQGHTKMDQVFIFVHVGWWNIVQVRMLHRDDFRQKRVTLDSMFHTYKN